MLHRATASVIHVKWGYGPHQDVNMIANVLNPSWDDFMQEDDDIPHVKDFIALQKAFDKPFAAGNAIARQQNKKPGSKAKAKAKAKAAA